MPKKEYPEQHRLEPSLWTRRDFLERLGAASGVAAILQVASKAAPIAGMNRGSSVRTGGRLFLKDCLIAPGLSFPPAVSLVRSAG